MFVLVQSCGCAVVEGALQLRGMQASLPLERWTEEVDAFLSQLKLFFFVIKKLFKQVV